MKSLVLFGMAFLLSMIWKSGLAEPKIAVDDIFPPAVSGWQAGKIKITEKPFNFPEQILNKNPMLALSVGQEAYREYISSDGYRLVIMIDNSDCVLTEIVVAAQEEPTVLIEFNKNLAKEGMRAETTTQLGLPALAFRDQQGRMPALMLAPMHNCLIITIGNNNPGKIPEPLSVEYIKAYSELLRLDLIKRYSDQHIQLPFGLDYNPNDE